MPALLQAMDLESGLSRLAIVEALGKLKATPALPRLLRLYQEASLDERRSASAGYRVSQLSAELERHYESLQSLEGLGDEYDEACTLDAPQHERLLTAERILSAIAEIDPNAARGFFCQQAVEGEFRARELAAIGLGNADPTPSSLQALRVVLADREPYLQWVAAISLAALGQPEGQQYLLSHPGDLSQLERIPAARLEFARPLLRKMIASDSPNMVLQGRKLLELLDQR